MAIACWLFLNGSVYGQASLYQLTAQYDSILQEISAHRNSIDALNLLAADLDEQIGYARVRELGDKELKLRNGPNKPWFIGAKKKGSSIKPHEELTILGYDELEKRIKVYSPSSNDTGYVVPIAFADQSTVQAYIESYKEKRLKAVEAEKIGVKASVKDRDNIRLLKAGTFGASIITVLEPNAEILVVSHHEDFFEVYYGSQRGYILDSFVVTNEDVERLRKISKTQNKALYKSTRSYATPKRSRSSSSGRSRHRGPRGGCYYINSAGKKVYVDRSKCN